MRTQRWTLAVVCAATAMLMLDIAVVNTALSRFADDLDTGLSGLQWVVDAYTLALASTVLTAGALADRLGRRRLFLIGLGIFTATSLGCAVADHIAVLNSMRAAQGIGAAIMFAVSLALLANAYPDVRQRAGALAAYGATIGASFAVGPLVGGALTSGLDWRWIFLINLPIGIACIAATRAYVQESRDPAARRIDWPGPITLIATPARSSSRHSPSGSRQPNTTMLVWTAAGSISIPGTSASPSARARALAWSSASRSTWWSSA